jgi:hypothetical protein
MLKNITSVIFLAIVAVILQQCGNSNNDSEKTGNTQADSTADLSQMSAREIYELLPEEVGPFGDDLKLGRGGYIDHTQTEIYRTKDLSDFDSGNGTYENNKKQIKVWRSDNGTVELVGFNSIQMSATGGETTSLLFFQADSTGGWKKVTEMVLPQEIRDALNAPGVNQSYFSPISSLMLFNDRSYAWNGTEFKPAPASLFFYPASNKRFEDVSVFQLSLISSTLTPTYLDKVRTAFATPGEKGEELARLLYFTDELKEWDEKHYGSYNYNDYEGQFLTTVLDHQRYGSDKELFYFKRKFFEEAMEGELHIVRLLNNQKWTSELAWVTGVNAGALPVFYDGDIAFTENGFRLKYTRQPSEVAVAQGGYWYSDLGLPWSPRREDQYLFSTYLDSRELNVNLNMSERIFFEPETAMKEKLRTDGSNSYVDLVKTEMQQLTKEQKMILRKELYKIYLDNVNSKPEIDRADTDGIINGLLSFRSDASAELTNSQNANGYAIYQIQEGNRTYSVVFGTMNTVKSVADYHDDIINYLDERQVNYSIVTGRLSVLPDFDNDGMPAFHQKESTSYHTDFFTTEAILRINKYGELVPTSVDVTGDFQGGICDDIVGINRTLILDELVNGVVTVVVEEGHYGESFCENYKLTSYEARYFWNSERKDFIRQQSGVGSTIKATASVRKPIPGKYADGPLYIAVNGTEVQGYYSNGRYEGNPNFGCSFLFYGSTAESDGERMQIHVINPFDLTEKPRQGTLKPHGEEESVFAITANINAEDCWDKQLGFTEISEMPGVGFNLSEEQAWQEIRLVSAEKAFFHNDKTDGSKGSSYVVMNDALLIEEEDDQWLKAHYFNRGKATTGWIKKDEARKLNDIHE